LIFIDKTNIFLISNTVYSVRSELYLSDETFKISFSVENYDEKTAENYKLFLCRIIQITMSIDRLRVNLWLSVVWTLFYALTEQ